MKREKGDFMAVLWVVFAMLFLRKFSLRTCVCVQYMMYVVDALLVLNAFAYDSIVLRILTVAIAIIDAIAFIVCGVLANTSWRDEGVRMVEGFNDDESLEEYINK
jgi:hypothetical protein